MGGDAQDAHVGRLLSGPCLLSPAPLALIIVLLSRLLSSAIQECWASVLNPLKVFEAHLSVSFPILEEGSQRRYRVHCLVFNPFRVTRQSHILYR